MILINLVFLFINHTRVILYIILLSQNQWETMLAITQVDRLCTVLATCAMYNFKAISAPRVLCPGTTGCSLQSELSLLSSLSSALSSADGAGEWQ